METFRKKAAAILIFAIIAIMASFALFTQSFSPLNANAADVVKVIDDSGNSYSSFSDAANSASLGSTLTLLENDSLCGVNNKRFTIDLNGKTLTASRVHFSYSTITVKDSDENNTGTISGTVTIMEGAVINVESGNVGNIWLSSRAKATVTGGKISQIISETDSYTVTIDNGEVIDLEIRGGTINLNGGKIGSVHYKGGTLNCTHNINLEDGKCSLCKTEYPAILTYKDNNTSVISSYGSFKEVIAKAPAAPATPTSLDNVFKFAESIYTVTVFNDLTVDDLSVMDGKRFELNLNGHKLSSSGGTIQKAEILFADKTTDVSGEFYSSGTTIFQDCNIYFYNGNFSLNESGEYSLSGATKAKIENVKISTTLNINDSADVVVTDGEFKKIIYYGGTAQINGENVKIAELTANKLAPILYKSGTIQSIVADDYKALLAEGRAYQGQGLIKPGDMKSNLPVQVVDAHTHAFTNGICDYCGYECQHESLDPDGKCIICDRTFTVSLTVGGVTTFYNGSDALKTALSEIPADQDAENVIVKLFAVQARGTLSEFNNKNLTLDLNGKKITTNSKATISDSKIIFTDSLRTGEIGIWNTLEFKNCELIFASCKFTKKSENAKDTIYFLKCKVNLTGGSIGYVGVNDNDTTFEMNGGSIAELSYGRGTVKLYGGTIDKFTGVTSAAGFKNILGEQRAYSVNGQMVRLADMPTVSGTVTIVEHTVHGAFADHVCGYCDYNCPEVNGENIQYVNGICNICGYHCEHKSVSESNLICKTCNSSVILVVTSSAGISTYYSDFDYARESLQSGDTLKLLSDISINNSNTIKQNITFDLNGKSLNGYYIQVAAKVKFIDSADGGKISLAVNGDIAINGNSNTDFNIHVYTGSVKFYSGKIRIALYNWHKLNEIIPENYALRLHSDGSSKLLTWEYCLATDHLEKNEYLTIEECSHSDFRQDGSNFNCIYCNKAMTVEEVVTKLQENIAAAKAELILAISGKADTTTLNEKVEELNKAIKAAEAYADQQDGKLKDELESTITAAKEAAINEAKRLVDEAKAKLILAISGKADTATLNEKVEELNKAIEAAKLAAESVSNAYADKQDGELKAQLEEAIAAAKEAAINEAKRLIDEAKAELILAISGKVDTATLNEKVEELNKAIEAAKLAAESVSNAYADKQDGELKAQLEEAIAAAKEAAINEAKRLIDEAKAELIEAIKEKVDPATLNEKVEELNEAIEAAKLAAESVSNAYADQQDGKLRTELKEAIAAAKEAAINEAKRLVDEAKAELTEAIDKKADITTLDEKISELNKSIEAAKSTAESLKVYADEQDENLRAELIEKIATAKQEAIEAADNALKTAKEELESLINKKANAADVNEAIENLTTAIGNAENVSKAYADEKDEALKNELNGNIAAAKEETINAANRALDQAKVELNGKINEKASKAEVEKAVADLNTAITNAENISKRYSDDTAAELKTELESKIAAAKNELSVTIESLVERLNKAEKDIDGNAEKISSLKTLIITFGVMVLTVDILILIAFFLYRSKKGR